VLGSEESRASNSAAAQVAAVRYRNIMMEQSQTPPWAGAAVEHEWEE